MKSSSGWWERLLKDKARQHWLRVDFQNWKDEDDVGDEKCSFEEVNLNLFPFTNDIGTRNAASNDSTLFSPVMNASPMSIEASFGISNVSVKK